MRKRRRNLLIFSPALIGITLIVTAAYFHILSASISCSVGPNHHCYYQPVTGQPFTGADGGRW
jgi:hypothetical protein